MWLVVGLAGVTCGGKTTLVEGLVTSLAARGVQAVVVMVDGYFLPKEDHRHVWLPEMGLINWEMTASLDVDRLLGDITDTLSSQRDDHQVLLIDGHTCLNIPQVAALCHLKYFFSLDKDECLARRTLKWYAKKDKPGYFDQAVWPTFLFHRAQVEETQPEVRPLDGRDSQQDLVDRVTVEVVDKLEEMRESPLVTSSR